MTCGRHRRIAVVALLSSTFALAPAWLDGLGLTALEGRAFAQPADAVTEVARARYKEGVKAFEAGKFEDARSAFLQAYALKRVPAVLLNLGQSELRTSPPHLEDAGNHLQQFLREHTAASADERAAAQKGIDDCKKRTGSIQISGDTMGADVSVDGTSIGKLPLADLVFVKPGKHVVTGTANGKTVNEAVEAKLGAPTPVSLTLGQSVPPAVVAPPVVAPVPAPPLPPGLTPPPASTPEPPPPVVPQEPPATPPEAPAAGQTFMQWYAHKPFAWVTTGVAGVGVLGGLGFTIASGVASGTTNNAADQIRAHLSAPGETPCAQPGSGGQDVPRFGQACTTLRDDISIYHTDVAFAVTGWVLAGVGAGATFIYAMTDWYPHRNASPAATTGSTVHVVPVASPQFSGLSVSGRF